jgi:hypothetical protein
VKPSRSPPARPYHHCPLTALVFSSHPIIDTLCAAGCLFPPEGGRLEAWYDQAVSSSLNQMLQTLPPHPPHLWHIMYLSLSPLCCIFPPTSLPPASTLCLHARPSLPRTSISVTPPPRSATSVLCHRQQPPSCHPPCSGCPRCRR